MLRRKLLTILLICFMSIFLIAQPISAQDDTIKWRMASVWSGNLRALLDADEYFAERVEELSGGKLQIEVYPAGELCNANEVLDMVQNGVVEAGGVVPCYFSGK